MKKEEASYTIPVSKESVDGMISTLIRENNRLSEENQRLREMQEGSTADADREKEADEMSKMIDRYMM